MNKIVLVSNLKGGTGKTSICELLAIYTVEKELPCMVLDADNQLDVYEDRKDDLLKQYDKIKTDKGEFIVVNDTEDKFFVVNPDNKTFYIEYVNL